MFDALTHQTLFPNNFSFVNYPVRGIFLISMLNRHIVIIHEYLNYTWYEHQYLVKLVASGHSHLSMLFGDMGFWFLSYVSWCLRYLWFSPAYQWWCLTSKCLQMLSLLGLSSRTMDKSLVEFHTKTLVALVPSIFHRISRDRQIPLLQVGAYSWIVRIFLYLVVPCYARCISNGHHHRDLVTTS